MKKVLRDVREISKSIDSDDTIYEEDYLLLDEVLDVKSIYERVLNLRNRISLDGDDTIYEQDYLLLDEVLDYIESNEQRTQEKLYNDTVDIYNELEIGIKFKKQEKLLELYRKLDGCIVVPNGHHVCRYTDDEKYTRIRKQIKELENEKA